MSNDVDEVALDFLAADRERDRPKLVMVRSQCEAFACRDRRTRQDIATPRSSSSGASLNQLVGAEKSSMISLTSSELGGSGADFRLCRQTVSGSIRSQSCSDFAGGPPATAKTSPLFPGVSGSKVADHPHCYGSWTQS